MYSFNQSYIPVCLARDCSETCFESCALTPHKTLMKPERNSQLLFNGKCQINVRLMKGQHLNGHESIFDGFKNLPAKPP